MRKGTQMVVGVFVATLLSVASGFADSTRYSAGGFEPPRFYQGRLAGDIFTGQDQWVATGDGFIMVNLDGIVVQDTLVKDGQQAVKIDASMQPSNLLFAHIRRNEPFDVTTQEPVVDVSLDFYLMDGQARSYRWGLDIQGSVITRLTEWLITPDNSVECLSDSGWVDTGFDITRGTWYNVHTVMNFSTNTVYLYFNGALIHTNTIITNSGSYAFAGLRLDQPGNDKMYVDNYLVRTLSIPTGIDEINNESLVSEFALNQNYPNPFNPTTTISYTIPRSGGVVLQIFNGLGQKVRTLVNDNQNAGTHNVLWNGTDDYGNQVSSGVYVYFLQANNRIHSRKLVYVK